MLTYLIRVSFAHYFKRTKMNQPEDYLFRLEQLLEELEVKASQWSAEKDRAEIDKTVQDLACSVENLRQAQRSSKWCERRNIGKIIKRTQRILDQMHDLKHPKVRSTFFLWCLLCCVSCCGR